MPTKEIKLLAKTPVARKKLNDIFMAYQSWSGKWFVLDQENDEIYIAPVGHPWDKVGRWMKKDNDPNFIVCEV